MNNFEDEFKYRIQPTETHKTIVQEFEAYLKENEKWQTKSFDAAGKRARAHLKNIHNLLIVRRNEIQETRNELSK